MDNGCPGPGEPNEGFNVTVSDGGVTSRPLTIQNGARTDALRLVGNAVGMGTAAPLEELHIFSPGLITPPPFPVIINGNAAIRLESEPVFGFGNSIWDINGGTGTFSIENASGSKTPFKVSAGAATDSLVINSSSNVGVGTVSPDTALHVQKAGAILRVEDTTGGAPAVRNLVEMTNNGAVGFSIEDRSQPVTWDFRTNAAGNFIINDVGVGDSSEMSINRNGNVVIKGNVVAQGVLLTSSRASKEDITPIKTAEVMDKLKKVEVLEWRYKTAENDGKHISPMAEDFYSLFKFGPSNKHINPNDLASVAIIAAKELQKQADITSAKLETVTVALKSENAALKQQLEENTIALKVQNNKLQLRLASLEKLITNLASSGKGLSENGSKVAIK